MSGVSKIFSAINSSYVMFNKFSSQIPKRKVTGFAITCIATYVSYRQIESKLLSGGIFLGGTVYSLYNCDCKKAWNAFTRLFPKMPPDSGNPGKKGPQNPKGGNLGNQPPPHTVPVTHWNLLLSPDTGQPAPTHLDFYDLITEPAPTNSPNHPDINNSDKQPQQFIFNSNKKTPNPPRTGQSKPSDSDGSDLESEFSDEPSFESPPTVQSTAYTSGVRPFQKPNENSGNQLPRHITTIPYKPQRTSSDSDETGSDSESTDESRKPSLPQTTAFNSGSRPSQKTNESFGSSSPATVHATSFSFGSSTSQIAPTTITGGQRPAQKSSSEQPAPSFSFNSQPPPFSFGFLRVQKPREGEQSQQPNSTPQPPESFPFDSYPSPTTQSFESSSPTTVHPTSFSFGSRPTQKSTEEPSLFSFNPQPTTRSFEPKPTQSSVSVPPRTNNQPTNESFGSSSPTTVHPTSFSFGSRPTQKPVSGKQPTYSASFPSTDSTPFSSKKQPNPSTPTPFNSKVSTIESLETPLLQPTAFNSGSRPLQKSADDQTKPTLTPPNTSSPQIIIDTKKNNASSGTPQPLSHTPGTRPTMKDKK